MLRRERVYTDEKQDPNGIDDDDGGGARAIFRRFAACAMCARCEYVRWGYCRRSFGPPSFPPRVPAAAASRRALCIARRRDAGAPPLAHRRRRHKPVDATS